MVLPNLLKNCKADGTTQKYYYEFMKGTRWAQAYDVPQALPADPLTTAIYLAGIIQQSSTPSPVIAAFYGIRWDHKLIDKPSPTDNSMVSNVLEAGKRKLAYQLQKKEPVTPDLLKKFYQKTYVVNCLKSIRALCMCFICYAGFLRSSELLNIRMSDIHLNLTHVSIFIEQSKTDVYRDGSWVVIARTGSDVCPVKLLEKYLCLAGIDSGCEDYIFRNLIKTKSGQNLTPCNSRMSYTRFREIFN